MSNVQSFCAFCHKKNGKLKCFLTNTLKKCLTILRIRKDNRLHSANVVLPAKFDNYNKYHRQCYARFTALPPKQRGYDPKKQASSSSERDALKKEVAVQGEDVDRGEVSAQGEDVDRGEVSAEGEDVNRGEVSAQGEDVDGGEVSAQGEIVDRGVVSVHGEGIDRGEVHVGSEDHAPGDDSAQAENCDRGEDVARRGDEIPYADAAASADDIRDKINDSVSEEICKAVICRFCNKSRKKHQGREQKLHRIENDKSLIHIEQLALDLDDSDFLHKLKDVQSQNKLMFYHNFCRNTYQNSHTSKKTKEKEKTEWHRIRDVRSKAYKEVCKFIFEKIVATNQAFFLSSLNTMFIDYLKENKEDADVYTTKPYHLKNRILSTFKGKISIVTHDNKKLVKPYKGVVDREFEEIEKTKF